MEIHTKNGSILFLDESRWLLSSNTKCEVIDMVDDYLLVKNNNGIYAKIHKSIFIDNQIDYMQNHIVLDDQIYRHYITEPYLEISNQVFNDLFNKYQQQIFDNKDTILTKAEFYLLTPKILTSYIGNKINLSLGYILESIIDRSIPIAKDTQSNKEYLIVSAQFLPFGSGLGKKITCLDPITNTISERETNHLDFSMSDVMEIFKEKYKNENENVILLQEQAIFSLIKILNLQ